jgi:hypothetical protein
MKMKRACTSDKFDRPVNWSSQGQRNYHLQRSARRHGQLHAAVIRGISPEKPAPDCWIIARRWLADGRAVASIHRPRGHHQRPGGRGRSRRVFEPGMSCLTIDLSPAALLSLGPTAVVAVGWCGSMSPGREACSSFDFDQDCRHLAKKRICPIREGEGVL